MYFNEHLKIVLNKAKYKLYKLQHTIYKLYESVIQPKLEYGLFSIANERKIDISEIFRRKAAKIALKLKKQTPTIHLDELLNAKSINYRLDVARIKLWNSRAPPSLLKHHTFIKWKKYILSNDGNINECKILKNRQIDRNESFKLNDENFNFISKSLLSQAYFTVDKIFPIECKIFRKRKFKPIPCFNNTYPSNVNIYGMNKEYNNPKLIDNPDSLDSLLWEFSQMDHVCQTLVQVVLVIILQILILNQ